MLLIGSRLMTVYLWHLPMIMVLTGIALLLPFPMPAPGGAVWWWTRVPFLLLVLALVGAFGGTFSSPRRVSAASGSRTPPR